MIVLDEQLADPRIIEAISRFYRGRVVPITRLADARRVIHDEAVPRVLQQQRGCLFVTINVRHFWRRMPGHPRYGIVCLEVAGDRALDTPAMIRRLLSQPGFRTRSQRCGKVILVSPTAIRYYSRLTDPDATAALD